jgi:guanyl-specific ribonuclease Sa
MILLIVGLTLWLERDRLAEQGPAGQGGAVERPAPAVAGDAINHFSTGPAAGPVSADQVPATDKPALPNRPSRQENLTLRNEAGEVVYRGSIDLQPTLDRIAAGHRLDRFHHDGSVFQNREGRLPRRTAGYYHEWVVPTPGESGPGPQRLITGEDGDVWYTHDHYRNFRRIR